MDAEQQAQLQAEVQRELERREWAEPDGKSTTSVWGYELTSATDSVMAEYITVLLGELSWIHVEDPADDAVSQR
jgi:hypothetical protein